jgi:ssDNA-binding Zn-finger/Zn-ribbon topoisomerase 1
MLSNILACDKCGWRTVCGEEELARRLRTLGLLRRSPHPPEELVGELLRVNVHRLACDACHQVGLIIGEAGDGRRPGSAPFADEDDGDWQQAVICQICRQPIPPERLEVFPDATRCAKCQSIADRGAEPAPPEFCPKCGALLEMRVSRGGGITRYKQFCTGNPPCRL